MFRSLILVTLVTFSTVSGAQAAQLEIICPDTDDRAVVELGEGEAAELIIYLKSFGDLVGGYRVIVLDDQDHQVGKNISDMFGVAKFTNMPAGRFRVFVEKKWNERGGQSTVSVGDLKVTKIRKQ